MASIIISSTQQVNMSLSQELVSSWKKRNINLSRSDPKNWIWRQELVLSWKLWTICLILTLTLVLNPIVCNTSWQCIKKKAALRSNETLEKSREEDDDDDQLNTVCVCDMRVTERRRRGSILLGSKSGSILCVVGTAEKDIASVSQDSLSLLLIPSRFSLCNRHLSSFLRFSLRKLSLPIHEWNS